MLLDMLHKLLRQRLRAAFQEHGQDKASLKQGKTLAVTALESRLDELAKLRKGKPFTLAEADMPAFRHHVRSSSPRDASNPAVPDSCNRKVPRRTARAASPRAALARPIAPRLSRAADGGEQEGGEGSPGGHDQGEQQEEAGCRDGGPGGALRDVTGRDQALADRCGCGAPQGRNERHRADVGWGVGGMSAVDG